MNNQAAYALVTPAKDEAENLDAAGLLCPRTDDAARSLGDR